MQGAVVWAPIHRRCIPFTGIANPYVLLPLSERSRKRMAVRSNSPASRFNPSSETAHASEEKAVREEDHKGHALN